MKLIVLIVISVAYCGASPGNTADSEVYKVIPTVEFTGEGKMSLGVALSLLEAMWSDFTQRIQMDILIDDENASLDSNLPVYVRIYENLDCESIFGYLETFIAQKNANVAVGPAEFQNFCQHLLQFSIATTELLHEWQNWTYPSNSQAPVKFGTNQLLRLCIRAREQFEHLIYTLTKYSQSGTRIFRQIERNYKPRGYTRDSREYIRSLAKLITQKQKQKCVLEGDFWRMSQYGTSYINNKYFFRMLTVGVRLQR